MKDIGKISVNVHWDAASGATPPGDIANVKEIFRRELQVNPTLMIMREYVAEVLARWLKITAYSHHSFFLDNMNLPPRLFGIKVMVIPAEASVLLKEVFDELGEDVWICYADKRVILKNLLY